MGVNSVYHINKGVNHAIEFKGLKAQYIWWLGGGILGLLFLFALLYITGVNLIACVLLILVFGAVLFWWVYRLSRKYGEHGLMKKMAKKNIPKYIKV